MAEQGISLQINSKDYMSRLTQLRQYQLGRLIKKVQDGTQPLAKARLLMYKDVMQHFRDEQGPKAKWQPLKLSTIRRRRKKSSKPLQDTGRLRMSISHFSDKNTTKVGTNLAYARIHNYGYPRRNIPQREFMWISAQIQDKIFNIFRMHVRTI